MSLPQPDPSNPALPAPLFADVDAVRGDHLRANNQLIWENLQYLFDFTGRTTDALTEGATNLYYTDVRAKAAALVAALTGFVTGSDAAIAATDTILQAFGKTQGQVNGLQGRLSTLAAAQASTSGTAIDFTGVPANARKITVMFSEVSLDSNDFIRVQIGDSGGVGTSGYVGCATRGTNQNALSAGFDIDNGGNAPNAINGAMMLTLLDASTNTWVCSATIGISVNTFGAFTGGVKSLSATLDRVRITSAGSGSFDNGKISCLYET